MSEPTIVRKRISQVYVDYNNGQTDEVVNIVLPLDQVILPKSDDNDTEENLSSLNWKIVD